MSFLHLPDDILFSILSFLKPPDLICLRKSCKRLQAFTLEPTVWRVAYRNSGYFLPPGPLPSQTSHDLERILLRAHRWNKIWLKQAQPVAHALTRSWSFQTEIEDMRIVELAHSRYISIQSRKYVQVYDLSIEREIFKYQAVGDEELHWPAYEHSRTVESETELGSFIPFIRNRRLSFLKITFQGEIDLIDSEIQIEITGDEVITIGCDFCIAQNGSNTLSLLHIPSGKIYPFPSTSVDMQSVSTLATIMPGYILLFHDTNWESEHTIVELFTLPDPTTMPVGSPIRQTHSGTFESALRNGPLYLSSDISDQAGTGCIWATALFWAESDESVRPMRITLGPAGRLDIDLPDTPKCDPSAASPYYVDFKVIGRGRARGLGYLTTREGSEKDLVAMYDIYLGSDGDLHIDRACVDVPKLKGYSYFDPFVGLIHWHDNVVEVLDLL
ncbi:hypothetical protein GYMLUDRAFT_80600 [Collybiopsis luxurians FD-317 M1]|nr:hypothetical protein GYMLUDRAFT_80600 [Collybiopsis luxurians FD-317 M1]